MGALGQVVGSSQNPLLGLAVAFSTVLFLAQPGVGSAHAPCAQLLLDGQGEAILLLGGLGELVHFAVLVAGSQGGGGSEGVSANQLEVVGVQTGGGSHAVVAVFVASTHSQAAVHVLAAEGQRVGVSAVAAHGSAGFVSTVGHAGAEAVHHRAVVLHGVAHALVATAEDGLAVAGISRGVGQDVGAQTDGHGLVGAVMLAQQHAAEGAFQADEAVAVSPAGAGVAGVDVDVLFNLPDGLQAVAQIFPALEADAGVVGGHAVDRLEVLRGGGGASGLGEFNGRVDHAVGGDVGQSGRGNEGGRQGGGKQFLVHGVSAPQGCRDGLRRLESLGAVSLQIHAGC